jgi:hypothetical protein
VNIPLVCSFSDWHPLACQCFRVQALIKLSAPVALRHRVWQDNPAAFQLAVSLMAAGHPHLAALGQYLMEAGMLRDVR